MSDSAVLNETARVLKLVQGGTPADAALRETLGRTRHGSAPALRRAVSRAVFAYFRWWRWLEPRQSLQKQAQAALDLQARFNRAPDAFKAEALAARAVPDWLASEMDVSPDWLRQLQREPVLWLRARQNDAADLPARLGDCAPAGSPQLATLNSQLTAFSYTGPRDLFLTDEFRDGRFEIQDLASQLVGHACAPQPGQTWWDACAGEGGKTLHLSDLMQNKGLIWASDRSVRRLDHLKKRAARAGMFNYRAAPWDGTAKLPTKTKFDGVLVDAPCSGVGTWQRNPHARWTTQPDDVHELAAVQQRLLDHVAGSLKPGGRLVYSVCTLTRAETTAVAAAFTAAHPEFESVPVFRGPRPRRPAPRIPSTPTS
ncbi:RsmB/NOP family class I SAM-dependent RNA methyltransferase [Oleiharenicola sp. Vm1]|uniref:RsmB/NOP family class I SAM-dependent RNA methyltransferase n=1 Tax=Oleiharenicola sp. Vm1 TaxID=3398393 RepID=UPI0039F5E179